MNNTLLKMQIVLFVLCFGLLSFTLSSEKPTQRVEMHVILLKIDQVNNFEEAAKIDAEMSTKDGILASRTNHETGVYFCYTAFEKDLKEEDFVKWFKELGHSITCFDKVVQGKGTSRSVKEIENCKL